MKELVNLFGDEAVERQKNGERKIRKESVKRQMSDGQTCGRGVEGREIKGR